MHAAQDLVTGLDEEQPVVARIDAAVARHDVAREEVLQLGDQLDAGVAAADDAHRQHLAPRRRVRFVVSVLGRVEKMVAQHDAVLEPLVAERVLLHPRHAEARHHAAHRDDQPIVGLGAFDHEHAPRGEVDVGHRVATEAEAPRAADIAQRLHDVSGLDHRGGHLRQQRREQQVVAIADQEDLDVAAIVQSPFEHAHGFHAGESAAEHHDAHHRVTSTPRSPAMTSPITIAVSPAAVSTCRARPASAARTMTT